jgi:hypothetical protein
MRDAAMNYTKHESTGIRHTLLPKGLSISLQTNLEHNWMLGWSFKPRETQRKPLRKLGNEPAETAAGSTERRVLFRRVDVTSSATTSGRYVPPPVCWSLAERRPGELLQTCAQLHSSTGTALLDPAPLCGSLSADLVVGQSLLLFLSNPRAAICAAAALLQLLQL